MSLKKTLQRAQALKVTAEKEEGEGAVGGLLKGLHFYASKSVVVDETMTRM